MALPLESVRVLDLSNVLAGPFCGYQLARMGAEVIKVENPAGGDLARQLGADPEKAQALYGLSFVAVNAAKRSIALDLKQEAGKAAFLRLVDTADVVLENFRPGVMERLGLGYDTLRVRNAKIIHCAISGFGQDGPWAQRPAYDQIVQGLSGVMSVTGTPETAPLRAGFPICDTIAGLTGAFAIAAAVVRQRASGEGAFIDVSLLESTLAAMGWVVSNHLNAGVDPQPMGNENFTAAPSGTFTTATGPLNISANEQKQFEALCRLIGRADLAGDPRFAGHQSRKANRHALNAEINRALAARGAAEWEALFNEAGVPAGRVLGVGEALASEQVTSRRFVEGLADARGAPPGLRVTRPGFIMDGQASPPSPPPLLGADTAFILASLGYGDDEIAAMAKAGAIACGGTMGTRI
jgi:crotonobetainyl-CoA:carnitine CoA-transferase CaiB-like acyl-CoA transferase